MFQRILVAIDGSDHASRALREAADIAERNNATLTVMTSVPDPSSWVVSGAALAGGIDFEALARESEREYSELLDKAVAALPRDLPVTKLLTRGRPGERILDRIKAAHNDLVVLGSRGRGEVRSLMLGSVSHEVLNASPAAVLIVHAESE